MSKAVFYATGTSYTGYVAKNTFAEGSSAKVYIAGSDAKTKTALAGITWGLIPGQDVPGAAWTGDATNDWTLAISEIGSYKLTESLTLAEMTVSAANAVIDSNKDAATITTVSKNTACGLTGIQGKALS